MKKYKRKIRFDRVMVLFITMSIIFVSLFKMVCITTSFIRGYFYPHATSIISKGNKYIPNMIIDSETTKNDLKYNIDEESINALAKTLYGECRGVASDTEKACVAWCILNRVDMGYGNSVLSVVSAPYQFDGYSELNPINEELKLLAIDVLQRWMYEKEHPDMYCGRVLPKDYVYFLGDGEHNWFTNEWCGTDYFDYNLITPYES